MAASNTVIEGVDPFKLHDLVFAKTKRSTLAVVAHLANKLILGDQNLLSLGQSSEVTVQQFHIQTERGLKIQCSFWGTGRSLWIGGFKVVVHGHCVGVHPPPLEFFRDFHCSGGFAGSRWAGQQNNGAGL